MSENRRDRERIAEILLEALAMGDRTKDAKVLVYLIKLALMEADRDFHEREYFQEKPTHLDLALSA